MKIVDLFGVGVPVVAVGFDALKELVKNNVNGVVFNDAEELGKVLLGLFGEQKKKEEAMIDLRKLKEGALKETQRRWDGEWDRVAAPIFGL